MAIARAMFYTPAIVKNVFSKLCWSPTSKIFPQLPYMPYIMNLKKLRFMYFNFVTQMGVKGC
jgi:hypothetical protein